MNPKYPIYIISKGRWESRQTSKALERMNVPYHIVVEPQEYVQYSKVISTSKILTLPFSNLNQGSIPVRNWVWEHSIQRNAKRHWILDDNMIAFYRFNRNLRIMVETGTIFKCAEDFTDRYENIGISGLNYRFFCEPRSQKKPYYINTRVYSCILINNSLPFRWRGKYNEDTDLSLRVLKSGLCTILFNAFLAGKAATLTMKGGNTDNVYNDGSNREIFVESLIKQHPDVVRKVWRYNRWHHEVDYTVFKNNILIKRKDYIEKKGVNNYGMKLINIENDA